MPTGSKEPPQQGAALHPAGLCSPAPAITPRPKGGAGKGVPFPCFNRLVRVTASRVRSAGLLLNAPSLRSVRLPHPALDFVPAPELCRTMSGSVEYINIRNSNSLPGSNTRSGICPEAQGGQRGGWKPIP